MKSISFPKIFKSSSTLIVSDKDATAQNLHTLLGSEKGTLFGDPYFGVRLKRYMFDQNNVVLKDILIDEIYTQLCLFTPQISCKRSDIDVIYNKDGSLATLTATIKVINKVDFTTNMYSLVLYEEEE